MEEAILRNYWLFTISSTIIGIFVTICIFKYDQIKRVLKRKITFCIVKNKTRGVVYDVMKELQPHNRRYIRQQVREYLKELQKPSYEQKKTTEEPKVTVTRNRTKGKTKTSEL